MSNQLIIEEIENAVRAHGMWKLKLKTAITTGRNESDASDVECDNLCVFGKWLYGPTITPQIAAGKPYEVIKRLHAEFHKCAGSVLRKVDVGQIDSAQEILDTEFAEKSNILVRALTKWKKELR